MLKTTTRLRTQDSLVNGVVSGFSYLPKTPRSYLSGTSLLGHKKAIVDIHSNHPLQVIDAGTKRARFFRDKNIRKDRIITDIKPVTIQQFKGFCSNGTLDTYGKTPGNWTQFVLNGQVANCLGNQAPIPYTLIGGKYWYSFALPPAIDDDVVKWCVQKAWSECAKPDGEIANALLEITKTLELLVSPMKAIQRSYRLLNRWTNSDAWMLNPKVGVMSLRTRRVLGPKRVTKPIMDEATNRWLEVQYGLLPTIGDAEVILAAIQDKLLPLSDIMFGKSKYTSLKDRKVYSVNGAIEPSFNIKGRVEVTRKVTYTSKVYYQYQNVPNIGTRLGFAPENFANVLWEFTPWSFVVDWLWGIGDLLHRIANADRISLAANYVSVKYDQKLVGHILNADYMGYNLKTPTSKLYYHQEELVRLANQPLPSLPQFNVKWFNFKRSLNALSLLWQLLPR